MQWVRATRARRFTVAGAALLIFGVLFLLFRGESSPPAAPVNVEDLPRVDGTSRWLNARGEPRAQSGTWDR